MLATSTDERSITTGRPAAVTSGKRPETSVLLQNKGLTKTLGRLLRFCLSFMQVSIFTML